MIRMANEKPIIKVTTPNSKKYDTKIDIYDNDPREPHKTIHVAIDTDNKNAHIIDATNSPTDHKDVNCYLTTSCMRHYLNNFDDNCEELSILRWFRDNFVAEDDIVRYYVVAPSIVKNIDLLKSKEERNNIYDYIYIKIIKYCVDAIKNGEYNKAYSRYKASVLTLEEQFLSTELEKCKVYTKKLNNSI